jgi:transposase InsO family protein
VGCGLSKAHSNSEVLVFHRNARLTVHGRRLIVERYQAGWKQAHIMTDNAFAYRHSAHLNRVCAALGVRQKFIGPHCPWQNGKVEHLNRTLATEWAYRRPFTSNTERQLALAPWIEHYNTERCHSALSGKPPISRMQPR